MWREEMIFFYPISQTCFSHPMAIVHTVAKSQTQQKQLSIHSHHVLSTNNRHSKFSMKKIKKKKKKKKNKKKLTQVEGQKKKLFKVQLLKIIPSFGHFFLSLQSNDRMNSRSFLINTIYSLLRNITFCSRQNNGLPPVAQQ